ncbi:putative transmembrane protein YxlG [compost metagenome]
MNNVIFFSKKELVEYWRTKKLIVLWIAFAALGIMSPLFAKLMPQILQSSFSDTMVIEVPTPTSIDSWVQFYKNISQIGIYLFIIMFSGIVNREVTKGTLINLVTKGLDRAVIIVSKNIVMCILWTLVLTTSFIITLGYTLYYFPDHESTQLLAAFLLLWMFGLFMISVILLSSTLFNSIYGSLFATIITIISLYVVSLWDKAVYWNPISLMSYNVAVVQGQELWSNFTPSIVLSVVLALLFVILAVVVLKGKKL